MQVIKKPIVTITIRLILVLALFLIFAVLLLQIPYVQTMAVNRVSNYLSKQTGFRTTVSYVNIRWLDIIFMEDIHIYDTQDSLMIGVESLSVDFDLRALLMSESANLDEVIIDNARVQLIRNTADDDLNINLFIRNLNNLAKKNKESTGKNKPLEIDFVDLTNSQFVLYEPNRDTIDYGFDYRHFQLNEIQAEIENFKIAADTVEMMVNNLTTVEPVRDFHIRELRTFYRICNQNMAFADLNLITDESVIKDSIVFNYNSIRDLNYFNDSINIAANISESIIHSKELAIFAPFMDRFNEKYRINGEINGTVSSMRMRNLELLFGNESRLEGNLNIDGLPDLQESFIDLNLRNAYITARDLQPYVKGNAFQQLTRLGNVSFSGEFLGFPYDFVANGTFDTRFGVFDSDINLKLDDASQTSIYSGRLKTNNFRFGDLIGYPEIVQNVSLNGSIEGSGLSFEKADFELKAFIAKIGVYNYEYQNINTDARLAKELFNGNLQIKDPNLQFTGDASIDFRQNRNLINVNARLDTLFPKAIGLIENESFISTTLNLNMNGNHIDELIGEASFSNTSLKYLNKSLDLDTLHMFSDLNQEQRRIDLDSKEFRFMANGNFDFTTLYYDLNRLWQEYLLNFENNQDKTNEYYSRKNTSSNEQYSLEYELTFNDINPFFELINQDGYVSKNTTISGRFFNGNTSILSAYSTPDTIIYKENIFLDNEIDISTSKLIDSANVLAMAYLHSGEQLYRNSARTDNISVEAVWSKDEILFTSEINQKATNNHSELNGTLNFLKDTIQITLDPSNSRIIDKVWSIKDKNKIWVHSSEVTFDSLIISSDDQLIAIDGTLSNDLSKKVRVNIENFKIENLNPLLAEELYGTIDGYAEVRNTLGSPRISSQLQVSRFMVGQFLVGNIFGLAAWEDDQNRARVDFEIERSGKKIMDLRGYVNPYQEADQLALTADFNQADLSVIEPFLDEYISEISGIGSGEFDISGTLNYPILRGEGFLSDGGVRINYLNTYYIFDGDIYFDDNEIGVRDMVLRDDNGETSEFTGGLFHDGFKDFIVNFQGNMDNFKVLNTTSKLNSLYYGTAIVSGDIEILGSFSNLNITANATTEKGTKFFIPINSEDEIEQYEFIHFVRKKDSTQVESEPEDEIESVNIQRLNFDFNLDITPDAYSEIIFDIKSGDIIRGKGNGKLKLQVDPKGDFYMFGDLEIVEGAYNFTLKNIINKEFTINPNSKISWFGDPYGGIMDIQAYYSQAAALSPLLDSAELSTASNQTSDIRRKYPARVLLDLKGDLLTPAITFDLDFAGYPFTLSNWVSDIESSLRNDEQELSRQVFSLVMLRKFSPKGTFSLGGGESVSSSVSELLSNQLSYWITQVDENLEIDVDLGDLDADAFNTFQLRLSYSFLDGRLRVTRDGGFTDGENNAGLNSIVGDWTVEYLLTPDGKLKAKMYNKNNYFSFNTDHQTTTTAGFSIQYTENFDKLSEIWKKVRDEEEEEEEDDDQPNTPADRSTPEGEEVKRRKNNNSGGN